MGHETVETGLGGPKGKNGPTGPGKGGRGGIEGELKRGGRGGGGGRAPLETNQGGRGSGAGGRPREGPGSGGVIDLESRGGGGGTPVELPGKIGPGDGRGRGGGEASCEGIEELKSGAGGAGANCGGMGELNIWTVGGQWGAPAATSFKESLRAGELRNWGAGGCSGEGPGGQGVAQAAGISKFGKQEKAALVLLSLRLNPWALSEST